jgi:hypothetical protein
MGLAAKPSIWLMQDVKHNGGKNSKLLNLAANIEQQIIMWLIHML